MRKITVLLCLLLLSHIAGAQIANTKVLKGAWKEVGRSRSGKKIPVTDTLFFEVVSSNLCIWGKSSPAAPRLHLKQIGTTLMMGPNEFDILEQQDGRMLLAADEGLEIEMQRYSNKKPAPVRNTNNLKFKPAPAVKMGTVPDKIEPFVGVWKCYKRTSAKPIENEQKYRLLRLVEVEEKDDVITAKIYGFEDPIGQPSWIVQDYSKGILFTSGKDERPFKVINCQANELIIENEGIVYYMNKMQP
ncbi:MAG TPA: hypothetical protein VL092_08025 [Chitinophagaceae bacterium]|nr:hypothetical protein [Chitinophagaceae bacterium]